jgi:hypothetical protein
MNQEKPNHHDAELVLKLYELRRETVMRESRNAMNSKFWPRTFDDFLAVTKMEHPLNAAFRQTSSYWEMVFGMAHHGIVHAEYLAENAGEGLLLYAKVQPFIERFRAELSPTAFRHAEWIATTTETGQRVTEMFQKRIKAAMAAM